MVGMYSISCILVVLVCFNCFVLVVLLCVFILSFMMIGGVIVF